MQQFKITIGNQSISFSEADLSHLEAAVAKAIRTPGKDITQGRVAVCMSGASIQIGTHRFRDNNSAPVITTDC